MNLTPEYLTVLPLVDLCILSRLHYLKSIIELRPRGLLSYLSRAAREFTVGLPFTALRNFSLQSVAMCHGMLYGSEAVEYVISIP